jgi:hypothetical protein
LLLVPTIELHFSDYFGVSPEALARYGAFNVSLINDLPLFVDPFLLFNSNNSEYQNLHEGIIRYLRFLRDKSQAGSITPGLLKAWFTFPEVKQNWLGYSVEGNAGSGLGTSFATALHQNLHTIFTSFGSEEITHGSHLEKLCLIDSGVGRDNISDFVVNLIKNFLLRYTQRFAKKHLGATDVSQVTVQKVRFSYETETWGSDKFILPWMEEERDFVILTPKNILTKDDVWISRAGLFGEFEQIVDGLPNEELRAQINNYFLKKLPEDPDREARDDALRATLKRYPEIIEYYIRYKEDHGDQAVASSSSRVRAAEELFVQKLKTFTSTLAQATGFYSLVGDTHAEARQRVLFLKDVIENKGGHEIFWVGGEAVRRESDIHILFRLCWMGTPSDVSREVDDGRGPADYKVSRGALDKTIVEFKLASNTALRRNLERQAEIYQKASDANAGMKVIVYFTESELSRVKAILKDLGLEYSKDVILIDARRDNKPSASKAR